MSVPAGFLVWVSGTRGPEPQRMTDRLVSVGSDYWSEKAERVLHVVEIGGDDFALALDDLARKYPAPGEIVVKAVADHRIALECDP